MMRTIQGKWVMNPEYAVLLHFVQIIDEMIWEGARELYRTPALNTYHRSVELIGAAAEISSAGLNSNILEPIFEELLYFSTAVRSISE